MADSKSQHESEEQDDNITRVLALLSPDGLAAALALAWRDGEPANRVRRMAEALEKKQAGGTDSESSPH